MSCSLPLAGAPLDRDSYRLGPALACVHGSCGNVEPQSEWLTIASEPRQRVSPRARDSCPCDITNQTRTPPPRELPKSDATGHMNGSSPVSHLPVSVFPSLLHFHRRTKYTGS